MDLCGFQLDRHRPFFRALRFSRSNMFHEIPYFTHLGAIPPNLRNSGSAGGFDLQNPPKRRIYDRHSIQAPDHPTDSGPEPHPENSETDERGCEPQGYRELGSASEQASERQRGDACNMTSPLFDSWWAQQGSNLQPKDYESSAPPLSYRPECSRLCGDSALYRKARTSMLSPPDNPSAWRNGSDAAASRAFCSRSDGCARA